MKNALTVPPVPLRKVQLGQFTDCQLHPYRTGKGRQDSKARSGSIILYYRWCCAGNRYELEKCPAFDYPLWVYRKWKVERTLEILFLSEKRPTEIVSKAI